MQDSFIRYFIVPDSMEYRSVMQLHDFTIVMNKYVSKIVWNHLNVEFNFNIDQIYVQKLYSNSNHLFKRSPPSPNVHYYYLMYINDWSACERVCVNHTYLHMSKINLSSNRHWNKLTAAKVVPKGLNCKFTPQKTFIVYFFFRQGNPKDTSKKSPILYEHLSDLVD